MPARPPSLIAVTGAALAAVAAWCSLGVLALADRTPDAPRVGLLPPWWLLAVLVASAVGLAVWLRLSRAWSLPLYATLPLLLPWLPIQVPAVFLAWSGGAVFFVWAGVAIALLSLAAPSIGARLGRLAPSFTSPARATAIAAAIACVVYLAVAWRLTPLFPGGDEPHYLIITQSLLADGDLKIENNYARGDYFAYFDRAIKPDFLQRGQDGEIYSVHAPGLAAIVSPAFALFGYPGVVVFLAVVSALATALVWRAAYRVAGNAGAAWFGWGSVAFAAPFVYHAFAVYPDATGAGLVMCGVLWLVERDAGAATRHAATHGPEPAAPSFLVLVLLGAALGLLPWLHTRYAVLSIVLGAAIVVRLLREREPVLRIAAFLVVPVLSAVTWFWYFHAIYGNLSPSAPYGQSRPSRLEYIRVALPAILFDQQFGLIPNAPVCAAGLMGLVVWLRWRTRLAGEVLIVTLAYLIGVATFRMWWGGWSAPARFTVPVLLPLGIPIAVLWARTKAGGRAVLVAALTATLLITLTLLLGDKGWLIFNDRADPNVRWVEWSTPLVNLARGLPSFLRPEPLGVALRDTAIWAGALLAAAALIAFLARRTSQEARRPVLALATPLVLTGACMVAATVVWTAALAYPLGPTLSQIELLSSYRPRLRPVGIELNPMALVPPIEVVQRLRLMTATRRPLPPTVALLLLHDLPAGRYRVRAVASVPAGTFRGTVGRSARPIFEWRAAAAAGNEGIEVDLPVSLETFIIAGDAEATRIPPTLTLQPLEVRPHDEVHAAGLPARQALRYGSTIVYFFDDRSIPEETGFWVAGERETLVVMAPDDPRHGARFRLNNGGRANRVRIVSGKWRAWQELAPGESRIVDVPPSPDSGPSGVRIFSETGFQPRALDPSSPDRRFLGCRVEFPE